MICLAAVPGNLTAFLNAPQINPYLLDETFSQLPANCSLRTVYVQDWPFLALFADMEIAPGEKSVGWSSWLAGLRA